MNRRYIRRVDAERILRRGQDSLALLGDVLVEEVVARCAGVTSEAEAKAVLDAEIQKMLRAADAVERDILAQIEGATDPLEDGFYG